MQKQGKGYNIYTNNTQANRNYTFLNTCVICLLRNIFILCRYLNDLSIYFLYDLFKSLSEHKTYYILIQIFSSYFFYNFLFVIHNKNKLIMNKNLKSKNSKKSKNHLKIHHIKSINSCNNLIQNNLANLNTYN